MASRAWRRAWLGLLALSIVTSACRTQPTATPATPRATDVHIGIEQPAEIADPVRIHAWDFAAARDALGWRPTHDLRRFTLSDDGLLTSPSGGDPYMAGPAISIDAASVFYIEIRMRLTRGNDAQLFWSINGNAFNERDSQHFTVIPDGAWHTYQVPVKSSPAWTGRITQIRLDPTNVGSGEIAIAHIRLLGPMPARVVVSRFSSTRAIADAGQPADVQAVVTNIGDRPAGDLSFSLRLPADMRLTRGEIDISASGLLPGAVITPGWTVSAPAGLYLLALAQSERGVSNEVARMNLIVQTAESSQGRSVILENDSIRLTFVEQPFGYGVGLVEWKGEHGWQVAGRLRALGQVVFRDRAGGEGTVLLYAREAVREADALRFEASVTDADGVVWTSRVVFRLQAGASHVEMDYSLTSSVPARLLAWSVPELLAGDGAFGGRRDSALFPGLEYLLSDDESSSTRFAHEPHNRRYVPHPNKITVPLMAVAGEGLVAGLIWDPLQKWDTAHDRPAALFASPNTWEGQSNHLMRLFVPGMTAGLQENADRLDQPYDLAAGQTLSLSARLFVAPDAGPLTPLRVWLDMRGLPDVPPMPRTYNDALRLSLANYREVVWAPEQMGWRYALQDPWGPGYNAGIALHFWLASMDKDLRVDAPRMWRDVARESMSRPAVGGQPNQWFYQAAFLLNQAGRGRDTSDNLSVVLARLRLLLDSARAAASGQRADGSWGFTQTAANAPRFGEEGDTSNGWVASRALQVLYVARITGDPQLVEAGLKALAFLERQPVRPAGAQTWELALHVPDILASAWIVQCFVEGYRLTGESHYLNLAQDWAMAGLPFVYLWNAPDRDVMRYATIPVFGATNYTFPWFGKPVMWNGLDYAFGLQALDVELKAAGILPLVDWRQVAEGITIATMQMQTDDPAYRGMYPDAWDVVQGGEAYTWWLAPTYLMQNILMLRQQTGALVNTRRFMWNAQQTHLSVVADIAAMDLAGTKLTLALRYYPGEVSAVLLSQLAAKPALVAVNGQTLPESEWVYERGMLVARIPFDDVGSAEVVVWYGE